MNGYLFNQKGVSLLEVIVATMIIGVLALTVSDFYVQRLVDYARNDTLIILQSNTKQALETMQRDIRAGRSIQTVNQLADANGPGGNQYGWASTTGSPSTLVISLPSKDSTGEIIYADGTHDAIYTDDIIYYIDTAQKALYRRTLANPISGNVAVTTCPPASANASCPADAKVIEDVANLVISYFDNNNVAVASPSSAYSLDVTLTQSRDKFGRNYTNSLSSRGTLRNKP